MIEMKKKPDPKKPFGFDISSIVLGASVGFLLGVILTKSFSGNGGPSLPHANPTSSVQGGKLLSERGGRLNAHAGKTARRMTSKTSNNEIQTEVSDEVLDRMKGSFALMSPFANNSFMPTLAAKRELGLSQEQAVQVKDALYEAHKKLEDRILAGLREEPSLDEPERGAKAYVVEAFPDQGKRLQMEIREKLREIAGETAGDILYKATQGGRFLGFGQRDLVLWVLPSRRQDQETGELVPTGRHRVRYELRDPVSGDLCCGGEVGFEGFVQEFGNFFTKDNE